MALTPQQAADKWAANLAASQNQIKSGIAAVQESPMIRASQREDAYIAGIQRSLADGKRARGLARRSLADWQRLTTAKVGRIASGAQEAKPDVANFMAQLLPYTEQVRNTIRGMPKGTEADSDARMLAAINMMRKFKRQ